MDRLYENYPDLYDDLQHGWDYERDVSFVVDALARHGADVRTEYDVDAGTESEANGLRLLEVGCGTGEHTRRFVERGFDVVAVDPAVGALHAARDRCDADLVRGCLPTLPVDGAFDAVVALRGVVNHLPPGDLRPALRALAGRLADGGVLVFDNSPLPPDGNDVALDVGETDRGRYARVARMRPRDDGRLDWALVVFGPDGAVVPASTPMTPFSDASMREALADLGLDVRTHEGFGPGDDRTVFVAVD